MKVGIEIKPFNFILRSMRQARGLTLKQLSEMSGVDVDSIQNMELLRLVTGVKFQDVNQKLVQVAAALELDFDEAFPPDYLDMLQRKLLPRRRFPIVWYREVSLDRLAARELPMLPGPDEEYIDQVDLNRLIHEAIETLSEREQAIIKMRFGIDRAPMTLEECGQQFGVTRERIREIEAKALRKLRHPGRNYRLKEFLK